MTIRKRDSMTRREMLRAAGRAAGGQSIESRQLTELSNSIEKAECIIRGLLCNIDPAKVQIENPNDLYKILNALSGLAKARVEIERIQIETSGLVTQTAILIREELRHELISRPDLQEEILTLLDAATEKVDPREVAL